MPDTPEDPVDHSRTARRFTGEAMKNTRTSPGLACAALGLFALVCGLDLLALGHLRTAVLAASIAILAGTVSVVWLLAEHQRVVRHEVMWLAQHPDVKPERPSG